MSFEEEFDKIVRQKAEGAEFPFDEKNWERARKMLDAERKVVGMGFSAKAYVMVLLVLCFGTAGYFVFTDMDEKDQTAPIALNGNREVMRMPVSRSEENVKTFESEPVAETPNEKTSRAVSDGEKNIAETNVRTVSKAATTNESLKTETRKQSSQQVSSSFKKVSNSNEFLNSPDIAKSEYKPLIAAKLSEPASTVNNSLNEQTAFTENTTSAKSITFANTNEQRENDETDYKVSETVISENETLEIGSLAMVLPKSEPSAEPEITLNPLNALDYFDEDYYTKEKYKKHYLDVEAGGAYLLGWKANSETDGRGFNWYAGINYGFYVTKKVSLSVGAQGYNISNIGKPFFNHTKTEYGFTSSSTQTMITAKSLYYAAIPLKIAYSINPQSQIGVGCNVGLLVSSRNVMDTYYYQSDVRTDKTSVNTKGFYDGMNTTNIQFSMFYKTKLTNRLNVNAEAMYTPSDIYRYTHSSISTANNFGFRLGLQYTLLER